MDGWMAPTGSSMIAITMLKRYEYATMFKDPLAYSFCILLCSMLTTSLYTTKDIQG
jgi:hypothetical protein